jgi:hypothetical protein
MIRRCGFVRLERGRCVSGGSATRNENGWKPQQEFNWECSVPRRLRGFSGAAFWALICSFFSTPLTCADQGTWGLAQAASEKGFIATEKKRGHTEHHGVKYR